MLSKFNGLLSVAVVIALSGCAATTTSPQSATEPVNSVTADTVIDTNVANMGKLSAGSRLVITAKTGWSISGTLAAVPPSQAASPKATPTQEQTKESANTSLPPTPSESLSPNPSNSSSVPTEYQEEQNSLVEKITPSHTWSSEALPPNNSWSANIEATELETGQQLNKVLTFTTGKASNQLTAQITPSSGTYGVGEVVQVQFNTTIPKADRTALTKHLTVTSSQPIGASGWYWKDGQTVLFRPEVYWPANAAITVTADMSGAKTTSSKGKVSWGSGVKTANWKTSRALIVYIDGKHQNGYVTIDGKKVRKFGVSTGKPGYVTRSGIKTITEKDEVRRMTNVGVTNDSVYDLQVPYTMRITETGEFLHGAPWDGLIGQEATSHGCTHLTVDMARWLYKTSLWGDPVITTGTSRKMETDNGPGSVWNIPWSSWTAG